MKKLLTVIQDTVLEPRRARLKREERIETLLKAVNKFPWNNGNHADTGRAYARELCREVDDLNFEKQRDEWKRKDRADKIHAAIMAAGFLLPWVLLFVATWHNR